MISFTKERKAPFSSLVSKNFLGDSIIGVPFSDGYLRWQNVRGINDPLCLVPKDSGTTFVDSGGWGGFLIGRKPMEGIELLADIGIRLLDAVLKLEGRDALHRMERFLDLQKYNLDTHRDLEVRFLATRARLRAEMLNIRNPASFAFRDRTFDFANEFIATFGYRKAGDSVIETYVVPDRTGEMVWEREQVKIGDLSPRLRDGQMVMQRLGIVTHPHLRLSLTRR